MNRKTNLFYSTGQDSNFVTFSNYTEALTGNILATDAKLFPHQFMCLYIPELDTEDFETAKEAFIKEYLVGYYENKLATLRDALIQADVNQENSIHPLDYLYKTINLYDSNAEITFIGDICEQEYNGTFMDNICIIENNAKAISKTIHQTEAVGITVEAEDSLHGWANQQLPEGYDEINITYDYQIDDKKFYEYNEYEFLYDITGGETDGNIKFNVLIPMFDIYVYINNTEDQGRRKENIPMGIWFSDKVIELDRTTLANYIYRPSWSLCISSQFKPFPYSNIPSEIEDYSNPDKFASFAMIMSKQAYILDEFQKLSESFAEVNRRLKAIELKLSIVNEDDISNENN